MSGTIEIAEHKVPVWVVVFVIVILLTAAAAGLYFTFHSDWTDEHVATLQQDLQTIPISGHQLTVKQSVDATNDIKKAFTYKELTAVITAVKSATENKKDLKDLPKDILDLLHKLADIIAKYTVEPAFDCNTCFGGPDCGSAESSTDIRCVKYRLNDPNPGIREAICAELLNTDNSDPCGHCYHELHDQSGCDDGTRHKKDDGNTCASLRTSDCSRMEKEDGKFINDCYTSAGRDRNQGNYFFKNKNVVDGTAACIRDCEEGNFNLPGCKDLCTSACHNLATQH